MSQTVQRYGLEACQAQITAVFHGRWEPGPEPAESETMDGARPLDPGVSA